MDDIQFVILEIEKERERWREEKKGVLNATSSYV
jgi:hypothetical protein